MRPIRAVWINDYAGSLDRSPEEEIAEDLPELQQGLGYRVELTMQARGAHVLKDADVDLVVFDYGGASTMGGGDLPFWQMREVCRWAREHEGVLVLLYTYFTRRLYKDLIAEEAAGEIQSENVVAWIADRGSVRDDLAQREHARAWFAGGDFEPYEDPAPPHGGLQAPGRRGR